MRVKTIENQQNSSLTLIWDVFRHQASLGVENPPKTIVDTHVAPLGSSPGTAFRSAKRGAGVGLSIFIGQYYDANSGLSYLNARYYNGAQGQFISEDPVFLGTPSQQNLQNPQSLNAYSYSEDNPIVNKDPNGNQAMLAPALAPLFGAEVLSGPIGWTALGITGAISAAYLYENLGAPNWQTTQLVSGQGYDTDPKLPTRPPRGPAGGVIFGTVVAAYGIYAVDNYLQPVLSPDDGLQPLSLSGSEFPYVGAGPVMTLPSIVIQGSNSYYRNSSNLLSTSQQTSSVQQSQSSGSGSASFSAQVASIQAQINQIQGEINSISQSKSGNSR